MNAAVDLRKAQPPRPVPASVTRQQVMDALQPFYALIGMSEMAIYDNPGITIGEGAITFCAAAHPATEEQPRPPGYRAAWHPQEHMAEVAELAVIVTIEVV